MIVSFMGGFGKFMCNSFDMLMWYVGNLFFSGWCVGFYVVIIIGVMVVI